MRPPARSEYCAGMGFYSAVWPLMDRSLADFQMGLAGSWITPDNSDNKGKPLAPEGMPARHWRERGPTWAHAFQTVEGGLGYWAGNHFRYGPPKCSMNATPQCHDYRFVDQPSLQQYDWSAEKKAKLQALVERIHATWSIDRDYMAPRRRGGLVALDPALLIMPPKGLEAGYVPIVTRQSAP